MSQSGPCFERDGMLPHGMGASRLVDSNIFNHCTAAKAVSLWEWPSPLSEGLALFSRLKVSPMGKTHVPAQDLPRFSLLPT